MDTVDGLKLSYLLVNNLLTKDDLTILFKKLNFIHNSKNLKNHNKVNIYENYSKKFNSRTKNLKKYKKKYLDKVSEYLKIYETYNMGKIGVIHGDPVLSNIIKKNNNDLIFLDPRGSLGKNFTIFGDINYDFAKVYQSLTGYENIILEKKVDQNYLNDLKSHFENLIMNKNQIDNVETLRYLTSSLYFTLINFHNKKYTSKFLDVACNLI